MNNDSSWITMTWIITMLTCIWSITGEGIQHVLWKILRTLSDKVNQGCIGQICCTRTEIACNFIETANNHEKWMEQIFLVHLNNLVDTKLLCDKFESVRRRRNASLRTRISSYFYQNVLFVSELWTIILSSNISFCASSSAIYIY